MERTSTRPRGATHVPDPAQPGGTNALPKAAHLLFLQNSTMPRLEAVRRCDVPVERGFARRIRRVFTQTFDALERELRR